MKKASSIRKGLVAAAIMMTLTLLAGRSEAGLNTANGVWTNGLTSNGLWTNGLTSNGLWTNGLWTNGMWNNGLSAANGLNTANGIWNNGLSAANGLNTANGMSSCNGLATVNGIYQNGLATVNGLFQNGLATVNGLTCVEPSESGNVWLMNGIDPRAPLSASVAAQK